MSRRRKDYKDQDGCHNCKFVDTKEEYDMGIEFFCNRTGNLPVFCLRENLSYKTDCKRRDLREKWERESAVAPWGICGKHIKEEIMINKILEVIKKERERQLTLKLFGSRKATF